MSPSVQERTEVRPPPPAGIREVPIPIAGGSWPLIRAAFPLSETAWNQMLEVLQAMKAGLVATEEPEE